MQLLARLAFLCLSGLSALSSPCDVVSAQPKHGRTFGKNVEGKARFGHESLDIYSRKAAGTAESREKCDALSRD